MLWRIALGIGLVALGYVIGKQVGRNEILYGDTLAGQPSIPEADTTSPADVTSEHQAD